MQLSSVSSQGGAVARAEKSELPLLLLASTAVMSTGDGDVKFPALAALNNSASPRLEPL